MSKVVLITGGSSGLGKSIGEFLSAKGYQIIGTSRNPSKYADTKFALVTLDVTDTQSISACVKEAKQQFGRIDILINNAGVGITGPMEEIPIEEVRANFETNYFGPIQMMNEVLPIMRNQNEGLIINITSIAAFMGLPFRGVYSSSKSALEIATEAYRLELKDFNINVCNLAPGDFATNIAAGRFHAPVVQGSAYEVKYAATLKDIDDHVDEGNDPVKVAKAVYSIINTKNPRIHYKVGAFMQKFSVILKNLLPDRVYERMLANHYKL